MQNNNNSQFTISIIVPTLNRIGKLKKLIDSIKNVNWEETELLIVDDSTQNFQSEIDQYQNQSFVYIHRGEKLGVSSARNLGTKIAKGKYIIFLDDDDDITENWFSDFWNASLNNYDLVFCNMKRVDSNNKEGIVLKPTDFKFGANGNNIVIPGAFMVKKMIFEKVGGYDERLYYAENTELFYRIEMLNPTRYFIEKANFIYYPSVDGGSKNLKNMIDSNKIILEKHNHWLPKNHKHIFNQIIAVNYMRFGDRKNASIHFFKAIKSKPFRFGTYIRLLISKSSFLSSKFYKLDFRKQPIN